MKRFIAITIAVASLLFMACAATQPPPTKWNFEKEAIQIHIRADHKLNFYENEAHTLLLCVYQLSDPNAFNQLSNDEDGLYTLLECSLFGDGAAASKRLIIQPGQDISMTLDRAEGARYVALTAGYYIMEAERMVKVAEIPEIIETTGFFKKKSTRRPAPLRLDVHLGPQHISNILAETIKG